jgi:hypothetical protein
MTLGSRLGSSQILQIEPSEKLKHRSQNRTCAFASVIARAKRSTSFSSVFNRWNAMRCALFGPTPGSLPSASINACIGAVYAEAMSVRGAFGYFFFG